MCAFAALFLLFGAPRPALALDEVTLQLKWKHQFQFAGYYAAVEKGYYRQVGLKVRLREGGPGRGAIKALSNGLAQYAVSNSQALLHRLQGRPVVVLAVIFQHSPLVFVTRKSTGISSPQQIAGKRVAMTRGSRDLVLQVCLLNEGISLDMIDLIDTWVQRKVYFDPRVDAASAYLTNEVYYFIEKGIPYTVINPRNYGVDFYGDCLITTEGELDRQPERVKAFREASLKGWRYAMAHPKEIVDLLLSKYGCEKSREHLLFEAQAMRELVLPDLIQIGHMNPGRWEHIGDALVHMGWAKEGYSLDGFLYGDKAGALSPEAKLALVLALGVAVLAALISLALFAFNRRLKNEMQRREDIQKALTESEERFAQFMKHLPALAFMKDHEGRYLFVNQAFKSLLGLEPEERLGKTDDELWPAEQARELMENDRRVLQGGETIRFTERVTDAWGRTRYHLVYKFPLTREKQPPILAGIALDLTERMEVERALKESEEKYRSVMESSADPMVVYDMEGRATYINPAFTRVFGWQPEELIGHRIEFVPQEEWPVTQTLIEKVNRGENFSGALTKRYTKDGRLRDVSLSGANYHNDKGELLGSIIILRDITEAKLTEAQLRQAQKMEAMGTLAGGVAHDFNNILGAVVGFTELAQKLADQGESNASQLAQVLRAAERASKLVRQMLAFSRKDETFLRALSLNSVVNDALNMLKPAIHKMIEIQTELDPDIELVNADPNQMEQVLINLAGNAQDAMPEGGKLIIQTRNINVDGDLRRRHPEMKPGPYVLLRVSDTGQGMDKESLERIFDPFFTTKEVGKGTGLGLSMVYGIVKSHGGYVYCQSEPGRGAAFNIYLPPHRPDDSKQRNGEKRPQASLSGNESVLLVDDERDMRELISLALADAGYAVRTVPSGEEALELCKDSGCHFDLVILDLGMPGMGGHKTLREILALNPQAKVLIASGYSAEGKIEDALQAGASGFIVKPFRLGKLLAAVRKILDA